MAFDTSALRTEWLRISVGMASQHRDKNQSVCSMLVLAGGMMGTSLSAGKEGSESKRKSEGQSK